MPRKARDQRLDTRTARLKLTPRAEPYWRSIQDGRAIGYRRRTSGKAGSWIARHYDPNAGRHYQALGTADDLTDADGGRTLNFAQAQEQAQRWFRDLERNGGRVVEPITVAQAMQAYLADYSARGGKALSDVLCAINAHILPNLGEKLVASLTHSSVRAWHNGLATAPARLRTKATAATANVRVVDRGDEDRRRARRATANRILTVLKAALNFAFREGNAPTQDAWLRVKAFPRVDAPRVRYLTDSEAQRLVNACPDGLKRVVTAALLTGCRYAELAALKASDLDHEARVLTIRTDKSGKGRTLPLSNEAMRFFVTQAAAKSRNERLFSRDDGGVWGKSHQSRPLREACAAAQITPAISFHILRHSFASRLARNRVPMAVIAAALGNAESICAKHYAHLAPSYVADTIRQAADAMGLVPASNIESFRLAG